MFGHIPRRNNRKARLSNWFAHEREGDLQAFDVRGLASGLGDYLAAVRRERALRRPVPAD